MRFKHIISISVIVVVIGIGVLYFLNMFNINERGIKMDYLKVKFYKVLDADKAFQEVMQLPDNLPKNFDREKYIPSEKYVGYAEYKNGKVTIDVTDPDLEEVLKSPTSVGWGERRGDMFIDGERIVQPGSKEHLYGVVSNLRGQGYTAITYDKEEPDKK